MTERSLVLIKPDAMGKRLAGHIISDLYLTNLKMIALKIIDVSKDLAEAHYKEHQDKPFFDDLIQHLTGDFHNNENVIAMIYEGEDAVRKIRKAVGETHPDESSLTSIRGKYGKVHTNTGCFETVIHASDSPESAQREIELWFEKEDIL